MLSAQQLVERCGRIGASDVPVIMGVSRWKTPYGLWAEKTKRLLPEERPESDSISLGHLIEPWLLDEAEKDLGAIGGRNQEVSHKDGVIVATLDGMVLATGEPVEAKTQGLVSPVYDEWGAPNSDEVPPRYYWQAQTQMACVGAKRAHLYALLGGRGKVPFVLHRDPRIDAVLEEVCHWFVEHIAYDVEPERGISDVDIIRRMQVRKDQQVALGEEFLALVNEYHAIKSATNAAEKRREEIQAQFILALGDAPIGVLPDMRVVKFNVIESAGYVVGPKSYRRLDLPRAPKAS